MASSIFPKFKSSYEPKTAYGRDVVKPYYENNLTPSVNWMMGGNAEHKQKYGSDYGSEDVEALSREYVLWRDANGISANYNKGLMPWVEQVRASAAQGGIPGAAVHYTPPVAATPVGAANTVNPTALSQGNAAQGAMKPLVTPAVKTVAQVGQNGVVTQNNAAGTQGTAVGVSASNGQGTADAAQNNGAVANDAGSAVTSPSTQVSAPVGQNNAAVGGTAVSAQTGKSDALWSADSFYAQIAKNKAIDNAKLDGSGLPAATVEALKAQSGLDNVGKNYQAAVKQAETDYARAQSRFGQNAEYLAQSGLSNSGFSDASDNAAYAAMQQAKVSAGENALAAQAEGQKTLWQRVAEEQTKLKAETQARESELLTFVTSKGLSGQEAINYLTANGMDAARAADIVASTVDVSFNAGVAEAAEAYIAARESGKIPLRAKNELEGSYPPLVIAEAIKRADEIMSSEEYKNAQDKVTDEEQSMANAAAYATYAELKAQDTDEKIIESQMVAAGMDYKAAKQQYDEAQADKLDEAFRYLSRGDTAGASSGLKSALGISDDEWSAAYSEGSEGILLRNKADTCGDSELRSEIYARSTEYELKNIDSDNLELIADIQKNIDKWARDGILKGEDLNSVRNAMNQTIKMGKTDFISNSNSATYQVGLDVNGTKFSISVKQSKENLGESVTSWNSLDIKEPILGKGVGIDIGVTVVDGKETLVFRRMINGKALYYIPNINHGFGGFAGLEAVGVNQDGENEIYNALVNKFR